MLCFSATEKRLRRFVIGVTDRNMPKIGGPIEHNSKICASLLDGHLSAGETRPFKCFEKGYFVFVQQTGISEILTLCEVQVFGRRK